MKMLTFASRNTKEILRDPLNLFFGLGFPMVLILPLFLELTGIQMAQSAADVCTLLCAIPIHAYVLRHMEPRK